MKDRFPPKFATVEQSVIECKESKTRLPYVHDALPGANLAKFAKLEDTPLQEGEDGYLYVRARAISSRVNKNNDGWPSEELAKAYKTFVGRPIFVDHNNDDPRRTRGVIVDARLHVDDEKTSALDPYYATAPDNHKPPTWVELLMEVDAKTFPELAKEIRAGRVTATSMGANIERSVCSVCNNEASSPSQYCDHVRAKGATFEIVSDNGEKVQKKAYEDCYGINFFEDSFVFDPADETALINEHVGKTAAAPGTNEPAPDSEEDRKRNHVPQSEQVGSPQQVDTLRDELLCKNCEADHYQEDGDGILRCPTCGNEQEPRPLDNPDLTQHQKDQAKEVDETGLENSENEITFDEKKPEGESGGDFIKPIEPINSTGGAGEISEMKFETKFVTDKAEEMDRLHPVTAARVETVVGYPGGIHGGTHAALAEAGLTGQVTYPSGTTLPLPDERPNRHFGEQIKYKRENGLPNLADVPVVLEFPDEQMAQAQAIVNGGGRVASVKDSATKKVIKPNNKPTEPKNEKVLADQTAPVESKLIVKDEEETMKEADRRKIVRTESPDGTKSEEIIEESGDLAFNEQEEEAAPEKEEAPESEEKEEPAAEEEEESSEKKELPFAASTKTEDSEAKLLAAFALADELVDNGYIEKTDKLAYVAKLEKESFEAIEARKDMLQLARTAGLRKQPKLAGLDRFPRVAAINGGVSNSNELSSVPDEAIFL